MIPLGHSRNVTRQVTPDGQPPWEFLPYPARSGMLDLRARASFAGLSHPFVRLFVDAFRATDNHAKVVDVTGESSPSCLDRLIIVAPYGSIKK